MPNFSAFTERDPNEDPYVAPPIEVPNEVYNVYNPGGPPPPQPGAPIRGGGGGGVGGFSFGDLGGKPQFDFGKVPGFKFDPFVTPSIADAQAEPGYQFRLKSGSDALERSAAAKGVLRTGGTLKEINEYGQNFGAQEYNNVFNRALSAYDRRYQGQKDQFAPQLLEYQLRAQAEAQAALAQYQRQFDLYSFANRNTGSPKPIPPPPEKPDLSAFGRGEGWPEYA